MFRNPEGALNEEEKRIIKALLAKGERNQDIQLLVNTGRSATVNSARITEVKIDNSIIPASNEDLDFYVARKNSYDNQTGLNLYDDERLIRAREAMILAVQVFNSPAIKFKSEVFAVQANIAWTYLLHEYYERQGVEIIQSDGRSLLLSQMILRADCPISNGISDNLKALKQIRDAVEHTLFRRSDVNYFSIFQACCLNFDKTICDIFGSKLSLKHELSFSLQFSKIGFDQITQLSSYDIPEHIMALDQHLEDSFGADRLGDPEYRFRVSYTIESATKSKSHIKFFNQSNYQGEEVKNVLVKNEIADNLYPYRAKTACEEIERISGKKFTTHNHIQAWRMFDVRPKGSAKNPENTNRDYCIYHSVHKDYTYSLQWVNFVADYILDDLNYKKLKNYRI